MASKVLATLPIFNCFAHTIHTHTLLKCMSSHSGDFEHPGIHHDCASLDRLQGNIACNKEPFVTSLNNAIARTPAMNAQNWTFEGPFESVIWAGEDGHNIPLQHDGKAIYKFTLGWYATGNATWLERAKGGIIAWGKTLAYLNEQIQGGEGLSYMTAAAEILRATSKTSGWTEAHTATYNSMIDKIIIPWNDTEGLARKDFFMNQGAYGNSGAMAIAVFSEDRTIYEKMTSHTTVGANPDSSIDYAIPIQISRNEAYHGQVTETGRDQGYPMGDLRELISHVKSRFELDGPSLATSFSALWELFLEVAADSTPGTIAVIVDAIDECEARTRNSFLKAVDQLINERKGTYRQGRTCIKFLITSRPSLSDAHHFTELMRNRIPIEQNQIVVSNDMKLVIQSRVGEIANKFQCNDEMKNYLEETLYAKSDQSILWLSMVLQSLDTSPRASKRDFEKVINTFPQSLEATYATFLIAISPRDREDAGKFLCLLIGASRHLTLTELNMAFTIDHKHKSAVDVVGDLQLSIRSTLQDIVGSFIRIKQLDHSSRNEPVVSLIHQSAKEYLTDHALRSTDTIVHGLAVRSVDAALSMSQSCIQYLLMEEFKTDLFTSEGTSIESSSPQSPHFLPLADSETTDSDGLLGLDDHLGLESFFKDSQEFQEAQCALIAQKYKFYDYSATHWAEHYSLCEDTAPTSTREAVRQLTRNSNCALMNWLKFYWIKSNIEYPFSGTFKTIEVAAFFNLVTLLAEVLEDPDCGNETTKVRALFWAARKSSTGCIKLLLRHGINPNSISIDRQTPLTVSAQHGHLDAVQILLDEPSTELTFRGKSGRSALSFAASNGHLEIVDALLERGAFSPDDQDNMQWTPLFWAVQGDYAGIIQSILEEEYVDVNRIDKSGRSVLSWAAGEGARRALKVLLEHSSVEVNLEDAQGRSPLSWAAGNGQREVVSTLMHRAGVDKSTRDKDMRNAISWACQGGHTDTLRTLLKHGCRGVDDVDIDSWTPLLWSLFVRSPATVEVLLFTRGVQIDRQDGYGRTALMWAASYGYLDVVQLLVSWNAHVYIKNKGGHTAADVARLEGQTEVWEFLESQNIRT